MLNANNRNMLAEKLEKILGDQFATPTGRCMPRAIAKALREFGNVGWQTLRDVVADDGMLFPRQHGEVIDLQAYLAESLSHTADLGVIEDKLRAAWTGHDRPENYLDIYRHSVKAAGGRPEENIGSIYQCAMDILSRDIGGAQLLCEFLERLARYDPTQTAVIQHLCHKVVVEILRMPAERCQRIRDRIGRESPVLSQRVLVRIDGPDATPHLAVWTYVDGQSPNSPDDYPPNGDLVDVADDLLETVEDERRALSEVFRTRPDLLTKDTIVEIMLPWERLQLPVEQWSVANAYGDAVPLGSRVPVVVRPIRTSVPSQLARERWNDIHNNEIRHAGRVLSADMDTDADSYRDERWLCVAINKRVSDPCVVVRSAHESGIPAVLWSRRGEPVSRVMNGDRLSNLPHEVWARRSQENRDDLVLLYDNPFWVPEQRSLTWTGP